MSQGVIHALSGVIGGVCIALIAVALSRLPRKSLTWPVYAFVAAGSLWVVGDLIATAATDMTWKQIGLVTMYSGSITISAFWWIVALGWAEDVGADLPLRHPIFVRGPLLLAAVMWLAMITNPWHEWFITPVVGGRNVYGPLWYGMAIPSYLLIVAALGLEVAATRRVKSSEVRRQAGFLIAASLFTLVGNILYVIDLARFNVTALVLSVSGALLVVGMARDGLFGVLPTALPSIAADHPDGLVVVGPDRRIRYANDRAGELLAPVEMQTNRPVATTLRDVRLHAEGPAPMDAGDESAWWQTLTEGGGQLVRIEGRPDRWLHTSVSAVIGRRGRIKGYCLHITDCTAERQAELHERQTRRLDSVACLSRAVSRDFQSAFAVILGNAELMSTAVASSPSDARKRARIVEAARLGLDLAHQLQLYTGTVDAVHRLVDLSALAEEMCGLVEPEGSQPIRIVFAPAPSPLPVEADPIQVRQVLFELLTNAVEAMPESGGEILVETGLSRIDPDELPRLVTGHDEPVGDFAWVRVTDDAGGMDDETEERAFEPFFSTRSKGRGSGLSTVLGIARAHDAMLALDNRVGQGCTLTFFLSLSPEVSVTPLDAGLSLS